MSDETPRLRLPDMPETPELYADVVADAFARLDAFSDLYLKGQFVNMPPASPADGDAYLTGASPTGAWSGQPYKIATCRDGAWTMLTPFNGLRAYVASTGAFIVYADGVWIDWNSMISAAEGSIASAATCDIGAAGSLFLQVTGTTTITSFGTVTNKLRFLRFAQALTLTHNGSSLVLPGAANIVTAAGDMAFFASDGSGNWRCRHYSRAAQRPSETGSWTPTDQSGAGLSFSSVNAFYALSNSVAHVWGTATYPTTSSTAAATIALPFVSRDIEAARAAAFAGGLSSASVTFVSRNAAYFTVRSLDLNTVRTNADLSAKLIYFNFSYPVA